MSYIDSVRDEKDRPDDCLFCVKLAGADDEAGLILARDSLAFAMLNAYPYNSGHLMVAPTRHVAELEGLGREESVETSRLLARSVAALKDVYGPDGFNVGMNLGRVAGAGVPGHLHWHVVPRWSGDTNFMPVVGETKVLPELLADTYRKLKPILAGKTA